MRDHKAAVRYARAFFEDAHEREAVDEAVRDLQTLRVIWGQSADLVKFLGHPMVGAERKKQVVREQFADVVAEGSLRFLDLLIDRQRAELLPDAAVVFQGLVDDHRGVVRARVRAAVPLTKEEQAQLIGILARTFGGSPTVVVETRPELIGGLTVRVKDTYIDGSVRTSLDVLAADLRAASLTPTAAAEDSGD